MLFILLYESCPPIQIHFFHQVHLLQKNIYYITHSLVIIYDVAGEYRFVCFKFG